MRRSPSCRPEEQRHDSESRVATGTGGVVLCVTLLPAERVPPSDAPRSPRPGGPRAGTCARGLPGTVEVGSTEVPPSPLFTGHAPVRLWRRTPEDSAAAREALREPPPSALRSSSAFSMSIVSDISACFSTARMSARFVFT